MTNETEHTPLSHMVDNEPTQMDLMLEKLRIGLPFHRGLYVWEDGRGMTITIPNPQTRDKWRAAVDIVIKEKNLPLKTRVDRYPFDNIIIVEGI